MLVFKSVFSVVEWAVELKFCLYCVLSTVLQTVITKYQSVEFLSSGAEGFIVVAGLMSGNYCLTVYYSYEGTLLSELRLSEAPSGVCIASMATRSCVALSYL